MSLAEGLRYLLPALIAGTFLWVNAVAAERQAEDEAEGEAKGEEGFRENSQRDELQGPEAFDYVAKDSLPASERRLLRKGCDGLYLDPLREIARPGPEDGRSRERAAGPTPRDLQFTEDLQIDADTASLVGEVVVLEGEVEISQGRRRVSAGTLRYDQLSGNGELDGGVIIRQPGVRINGRSAAMDSVSSEAEFSEASFVLHERHLRGTAQRIEQTANGTVRLQEGRFTSCEPGGEAWVFSGEEITLDRQAQVGTGKNLKLELGGVPVLWLPYVSFPVGDDRKSGLLFPTVGSSERGGIDISVPYYFNLAPNYDLTVAPRLMTGRGLMMEAEGRHLSQLFGTVISGAYLSDDKDSNDEELQARIDAGLIAEEDARPNRGDDRWQLSLLQRGGAKSVNSWYSEIDYTAISDTNIFRDFGSSFSAPGLDSNSRAFFQQSAIIGARREHLNVSLAAQDFELLLIGLESPYRRLPESNLNFFYDLGDGNLHYDLQYVDFSHDSRERIEGARLFQHASIDYHFKKPWMFAKPQLGARGLAYQLDENSVRVGADSTPEFYAPEASFDAGLIFENVGESSTQLLKPRLFYLFRDQQDQSSLDNVGINGESVNFDTQLRTFSYDQLYRETRFAGFDRLDDANSLTLGLSYEKRRNADYKERLRLSLGQIIHFADREVLLRNGPDRRQSALDRASENSSELAAEGRVAIGETSSLNATLVYDTRAADVNRATAGVHLASSDYGELLNLRYSYLREAFTSADQREDIEQIDVSWLQSLGSHWSWFARYNYDLGFSQELESFVGFEYDNCCYRFRFLGRRWLDSNLASFLRDDEVRFDQGVFFELELKGLGGSGKRITRLLEEGIDNFSSRAVN